MQFIAKSEPAAVAAAVEPQWKFYRQRLPPRHHCLLYRDDNLGVQKQVLTRRKTFLFAPKERSYFFIDGYPPSSTPKNGCSAHSTQSRRIRGSFSLSR